MFAPKLIVRVRHFLAAQACIIKHMKFITVGHMFGVGYGVTPEERVYTCLPLYHSAGGMLGAGCMLVTGCTLIIARPPAPVTASALQQSKFSMSWC